MAIPERASAERRLASFEIHAVGERVDIKQRLTPLVVVRHDQLQSLGLARRRCDLVRDHPGERQVLSHLRL